MSKQPTRPSKPSTPPSQKPIPFTREHPTPSTPSKGGGRPPTRK